MIKDPFRTDLGRNVFYGKYAHGPSDSWHNLAIRLVDDVCGTMGGKLHPILSKTERDTLVDYISRMLFIPGGRYLYYAGRPLHAWNNCLSSDTRVMTDAGWRQINNLGAANVLSPVDGKYYPAEFVSRGVQQLNKITFATKRGHQRHTWEVKATRNHHWPIVGGLDTYDLRVGDTVPANTFDAGYDSLGFVHGFMFGDGNAKGQLRICCAKDKQYLDQLCEIEHTLTYPVFAKGDPLLYYPQKVDWKNVPSNESSPAYKASFIRGWLAADGCVKGTSVLCSVNKEALEWFRDNAAFAGIVITGELRYQERNVVIGDYNYENHKIYIQNWQDGEEFAGFKVVSIESCGTEEVFCPFEPVHNRIVIDNNIDTYQCFLLKAEEDTREEWSNLIWRANSCLMLGGGIGIDYSAIRPSGRALSRTGGISSGPLPLMQMVNEIGRNVMQGGSRRSAIYASLNWKHEDIEAFLSVKDWHNKPIGTTGLSYADIKEQDFNFPAPLDMTNISVNYDDDSMLYVCPDGRKVSTRPGRWEDKVFDHTNKVFLENCRQAMKTGEPGFSFNFGDKQNETLRNACTEVTSEDDSDVCNLGSINLGNISSLEEFKDVANLASKFLVCGTIRADLPYDKVKTVREKNRRLGLGLMGIHEWLLKKGYSYEVVPELKQWLEVYKNESKRAADEHCDRLYLSRPVAYRAIAPTGSIGILAGTTTGIEPLFAVAYKRRYLTDGTRWKYEYVVDHTAETLIREHGIKPDTIETAYSLSGDYEKRIKFQADIQDYVDMSISSTINLPSWGSEGNNEDSVGKFSEVLAKYAPRLRGFTCYPDGSRGGQPITEVPYSEAIGHKGVVYEENDSCKNGICGM